MHVPALATMGMIIRPKKVLGKPEAATTPLIDPTRLSEQIDVAIATRIIVVKEAPSPTSFSWSIGLDEEADSVERLDSCLRSSTVSLEFASREISVLTD